MGTVLYEFSFSFKDFMFFAGSLIFLPVCFFGVGYLAKHPQRSRDPFAPTPIRANLPERESPANAESPGCILTCLRVFIIFLGITFFLGFISFMSEYTKLSDAYKQGDYAIVEGYVEKYDPMPYTGHSQETFELDGVPFSYSDYGVQWGYHNAASHGGVIDREGQHLRIGYYPGNSAEKNIILYIEALPGDADDP